MVLPPQTVTRGSFVRRFLRGDYSLAFSYCAVGLALSAAVALLLAGTSALMRRHPFNPYEVLATVVVIWSAILGGQLFQSIGVWRSAERHRRAAAIRGRRGFWGIAAQVLVIAGGLGSSYAFATQGLPQLAEGWRMAFEGDPDIPPYALRLMRNGREAEITGGFKFGLARDAARLFAAAPQLEVVHLNSGGGRLGEAIALAALIRRHGLATYTSTACASACTIAYVAGRRRYLREGAQLGFHRAIFAGVEQTDEMRATLLAAHVEPAFIDRAMAQPSQSIWYPTVGELLSANVVSAVVESYRFAASGLGPQPSLDDFKAMLRLTPALAALEEVDRRVFEDSAELYQRRYFEGMPDGLIGDEIRFVKLEPLLHARLARAPDDLLMAYIRLAADEIDALGANDARICFVQASGTAGKVPAPLPSELEDRAGDLSLQLLKSKTRALPPTPQDARAARAAVMETMARRYRPEQLRLLEDPDGVTPAQYALFCEMSGAMFRTLALLPAGQARAEIIRLFGKPTQMASPRVP